MEDAHILAAKICGGAAVTCAGLAFAGYGFTKMDDAITAYHEAKPDRERTASNRRPQSESQTQETSKTRKKSAPKKIPWWEKEKIDNWQSAQKRWPDELIRLENTQSSWVNALKSATTQGPRPSEPSMTKYLPPDKSVSDDC